MLPYVVILIVVWTILLAVWHMLGPAVGAVTGGGTARAASAD